MSVQFTVEMQDGSSLEVGPERVVNDLTAAGIPAKLSGDMMNVEYEIDGQRLTRPVKDLLADTVGPVSGFSFMPNANFDMLDSELRMAVESLPNDSMRKKYLEFAMTGQGIENPQIVGMGRDWGVVDPSTGELKALTNHPEFDMSDLGTVATEAVRFLGAGLGGAAGVAAGGGLLSVPASAAGAMAGSGLAQSAMQGILAGTDESYAKLLGSLSSEEQMALASNIAKSATIDAAGAGFGGAVGYGISKAFPGFARALGSAPISRTVEKGSKLAEDVANVTAQTARGVNTPLGRGVFAEVGPGLGAAQLGGFAAQAPAAAVRVSPKVANWFRRQFDIPEVAEDLIKPVDRFGEKAARAFRRGFGDEPLYQDVQGKTAADIMADTFGKLGQGIGARKNNRIANKVAEEAYQNLTGGVGPVQPSKLAMEQSRLRDLAKEAENYAKKYKKAGEKFGTYAGRTVEAVGAAGRGVERTVDALAGTGLRAAEYGARGLQGLAMAPRLTAQFAAPLEARAYGYVPGRLAEENYFRGRE